MSNHCWASHETLFDIIGHYSNITIFLNFAKLDLDAFIIFKQNKMGVTRLAFELFSLKGKIKSVCKMVLLLW